jgi:hypothetical protein
MGIEMLGIDTTTIGIYGTFLIDMINNISYDIIYSYFTVCSFVLFVAYESIYAPPADVIEEKVPLDKVSEAN